MPLVGFLNFVNNSDDASFATELDQHLELDAFARYLAIEDLFANIDDIDGPGNNSYLYYDTKTERFTIVAWDHNLAFTAGPGGGFPPNGFPAVGADSFDPSRLPPGVTLPEGFDPSVPERAGITLSGNNPLVRRFNEIPEYKAMYDAATVNCASSLFTSGTAADLLATHVETCVAMRWTWWTRRRLRQRQTRSPRSSIRLRRHWRPRERTPTAVARCSSPETG